MSDPKEGVMVSGGSRKLLALCAMALLGLLPACSTSGDSPSSPTGAMPTSDRPDAPTSTSLDPDAPSAPQSSAPGLVPRDDLQNEHYSAYNEVEVVDQQHLRIHFISGTPECYGARAVVREEAEAVKVAVVVGNIPESADVCRDIGVVATLLVNLDQPLGTRKIVPLPESEVSLHR
ncbi:hypothetical protein [Glutamicibacter sp. X7]